MYISDVSYNGLTHNTKEQSKNRSSAKYVYSKYCIRKKLYLTFSSVSRIANHYHHAI